MIGACEGCSLVNETLSSGIAVILKEEVEGVIEVLSVDDKPKG